MLFLHGKNEDLTKIQPTITLNENLRAPVSEGQVVGTATYVVDNNTYTTDVYATHNVEQFIRDETLVKIGIGLLIVFILGMIIILIKSSKKHSSH